MEISAARLIILAGVIAASVCHDIRAKRIPNRVIIFGALAGLASSVLPGSIGLAQSLGGLGMGLAMLMPLYALRAMGAGDVKLMAALGAIAGPGHWFLIFLAAGILGAVAALVLSHRYGRGASTLLNTVQLARELAMFRAPWRSLPQVDYHHEDSLRLPYGAIIAAGIIILAVLRVV